MNIKILMENTTTFPELSVEHGLSIYIESDRHKILFDTGQSEAFARNAEVMGVDLREVDIAILSHGHYDHSGGWEKFFQINDKALLFINEHAFGAFYSGGGSKEIGIPDFLKNHLRVRITEDECEIEGGLKLYTCNHEEKHFDMNGGNLMTLGEHGMEKDGFHHEQYLLIEEENQRILISGCSHKGIINITEWFQPDVLIGGFHYKDIALDENGCKKLDENARELMKYKTKFYTCHCTGVEQYEYLKKVMGEQVSYVVTGDSLVL